MRPAPAPLAHPRAKLTSLPSPPRLTVLTAPWISTPSDGVPSSDTLRLQHDAEQAISHLLTDHLAATAPPALHRDTHARYLTKLLTQPLPKHFTGLDASRPWLLYWAIHALALLDGELDRDASRRVVDTLRRCQNKDGGFGGGPGQLSHLAPSYAAVCALAYTGEEGWNSIDGCVLLLLSLLSLPLLALTPAPAPAHSQTGHVPLPHVDQAARRLVHHARRRRGRRPVRPLPRPSSSSPLTPPPPPARSGCYCALTVTTLLNILTPDLARNTAQFIASCQTYEGGLASSAHPFAHHDEHAAPLGEAHGGYAFCAAASWAMLRAFSDPSSPSFLPPPSPSRRALDVRALLRWSASLQAMPIEGGGFRGRTNKLVDGCYSWWGGGLLPIVQSLLDEGAAREDDADDEERRELYDRSASPSLTLSLCRGRALTPSDARPPAHSRPAAVHHARRPGPLGRPARQAGQARRRVPHVLQPLGRRVGAAQAARGPAREESAERGVGLAVRCGARRGGGGGGRGRARRGRGRRGGRAAHARAVEPGPRVGGAAEPQGRVRRPGERARASARPSLSAHALDEELVLMLEAR